MQIEILPHDVDEAEGDIKSIAVFMDVETACFLLHYLECCTIPDYAADKHYNKIIETKTKVRSLLYKFMKTHGVKIVSEEENIT